MKIVCPNPQYFSQVKCRAILLSTLGFLAVIAATQITAAESSYSDFGSRANLAVRGQLRPAEHTLLSAGIAGQITAIAVKTGSIIKQGELLVRFDCREQEAQQDIFAARLQAARTQLDVNDRLQSFNNISTLEVDLARAEMAIAEAESRRNSAVLDKCEIHAPFDGTVVARHVQVHQYVGVGEALLQVVNPASLEIEAVIPSSALSWVKVGEKFSLQLDETGAIVVATIDRLVGEVDPVSQTLRIFGRIDSTLDKLLPGMSGRLIFDAAP